VNGPRAWDLDIAIDVTLADHDANHRLALRNGVLVQRRVPADASTASVTIKLDNAFRLLMMAMGDFSSPGVEISGEQAALQQFLGVLDRPDPSFNIITP
jgi:alkyl sulfatase BDS1-like metallo-beta-lactamase superfamily hydrolase